MPDFHRPDTQHYGLRQKWAKLTDDDLEYVGGKYDELLGCIQKRTGETREAVEKVIKETSSASCVSFANIPELRMSEFRKRQP